jgi:hypothetical protein
MSGHYTMPRTSCPVTKATKKRSVKKNMKGGNDDALLRKAISGFSIFNYHGKLNDDDEDDDEKEYNKNEKLRAEILQDNNKNVYDMQRYFIELFSNNHSNTGELEEILLPFYDNAGFNEIIKKDIDMIYNAVVKINKAKIQAKEQAEAKRQAAAEQQGSGSRHKKPSVPQSKEILGKQRRIYKVAGSRKEHVKYKGQLIPVSDYKKLMKLKR